MATMRVLGFGVNMFAFHFLILQPYQISCSL